jgi:hypothetical protein
LLACDTGAILAAGVASTAAQLGAGTPDSVDGLLSAAGAAVVALPGAVEEVNREVLLPGLEAVAGDIHTLAKGAEQQVSKTVVYAYGDGLICLVGGWLGVAYGVVVRKSFHLCRCHA